MKSYVENNRLVVEADEGMILTDGAELYVKKYDFPVGVEKNNLLHEITEAEYNEHLAEQLNNLQTESL